MNGFAKAGKGAAAAVAAVILMPAGIAFAGYQDGPYTGTTETQMESISFRAVDGKIRRLATVVYAECTDATRQRITVEKGRTDIDDDRFSLELTGASDLAVEVIGRLRGGRAAGRVEAVVKPPGTTCKADLRWTAALGKPR